MRAHRDRLTFVLGAVFSACGCAALLWAVIRAHGTGDYALHGPIAGDNAAPAIGALVHGHLAAMVHMQPLMGLISLVWRAPFAGLATWLGGGERLVYGIGCAVCLLPAAALVGWLVRRVASARELAVVVGAAALIVAGPATLHAVRVGHPEEVLATVLATGAVICAAADRRGWAAVLLGLAIGTKQWALLAAPCVLLALPGARSAVAAKAALVALPAVGLLPLASPAAFSRADGFVGSMTFVDPFSIWWLTGPQARDAPPHTSPHQLPFGVTRSEAAATALLLALAVISIYGRRARVGRAQPVDGLALLALLGLARCITDPDPLTYNFVAVVIPLAVWETTSLKRLPVTTALTCVVLALLPTGPVAFYAGSSLFLPAPILNVLWTAGAMALAVYLTRRAFDPRPVVGARRELPRISESRHLGVTPG